MSSDEKLRILIADDHFVVRMGLVAIINSQPDMTVVAEAGDGRETVELFSQHRPDIALIDIRMPEMNGIEATAEICRRDEKARVIVLTTYDGDEDIHRALKAGARAYLLKSTLREELLKAIRNVHAGRRHIPSEVAVRLAERAPGSELTARETEVMGLIVKGLSNREIAIALSIAEGTVKMHINTILSKLGVEDRTQATTVALQRGIVHLD
ncbi:MAG TPA: response regulator transcription factor [Blastocatellia bacterium]|jgi:two-component system NarL family response regulator